MRRTRVRGVPRAGACIPAAPWEDSATDVRLCTRVRNSQPRRETMKLVFLRCAILALGGTAFITACNSPTAPTGVAAPPGSTAAGPDISLFLAGAARGVTTEPCPLSGGTATTCYRITVVGLPSITQSDRSARRPPPRRPRRGVSGSMATACTTWTGSSSRGFRRSTATTTGCFMTRTGMSTSPLPKKRSKARRGPMSPRNTRTIA